MYCEELWMLGCEAFGFNLLGKEEWLGWLICQQDIGWLNQGERGGRESFWKGNDWFCFMYLYFKGNTKLYIEAKKHTLVQHFITELTIHGKTKLSDDLDITTEIILIKCKYVWSAYYMPDIVLSTYLTLTTTLIGIAIPIFQMRRVRPREIK